MTYKTHHLAIFVLAAVGRTAGAWSGMHFLIEPLLADPRPLHEFFFERSSIQWVILGVFFFVFAALFHRLVYLRSMLSGLRSFRKNRPLPATMGARMVTQRLEHVRSCKEESGPIVAAGYGRELAGRDEAELERAYGLFGQAIQLLLALGFFGTVWGVSQSMFGSLGNLEGASTEVLKKLILGDFSRGLSTALDTTVLGIVTSLVATVIMVSIKWSETHALQALETLVCSHLSLETALHRRDAEPWQRMKAEWSATAASLLRATETALSHLVARSAQGFETALQEAVQQQLDRSQTHERQVSEALADALRQQVALALQAIEEQGAQTCGALTTELRGIAEHLHRVPEVSIRYPNSNGKE